WTQSTILTPSEPAGEYFGTRLAMENGTLIAGAPDVSQFGAAYVFVQNAGVWTQQAKLVASDGARFDSFGDAVALSGDTAFIGAPYDDGVAAEQGSVYVFQRTGLTWSQEAKLIANDPRYAIFGCQIAVSANRLAIGAVYFSGAAGSSQGAVYIFSNA